MSVASFGPGSLGCNIPTQEQQALSQIINLLSAIACKDSASAIRVTTDCLQVSVAGAWGEVGDIIQVLRWFDTRQVPPTSFSTVYINTTTNTAVTGITTSNTVECPTGGDGPITINGVFNFEYFICDNGTPKIVQVCGQSCGDYNLNYLALDRQESTEPADWNLVTAGACPPEMAIYSEGINTGLTDDVQLVSGKARTAIIDQSLGGTDGSIIPFAMDLSGRLVNLPYANPNSVIRGFQVIAGDARTTMINTGGVGVYFYITDIIIVNLTALNDAIDIQSGILPAFTPISMSLVRGNDITIHRFNIPLRTNADNEGVIVQASDPTSNVAVTILGYYATI